MSGSPSRDSKPDSHALQHPNGTPRSTIPASPQLTQIDTSSLGHTPRHATPLRTSFEASPNTSPERITLSHAESPHSSYPAQHAQFRSATIAPSPPAPIDPASTQGYHPPRNPPRTPSGSTTSSLRYYGAIDIPQPTRSDSTEDRRRLSIGRTLHHKTSNSSLAPVSRTPSFKRPLSSSLGSASGTNSLVNSPLISALGDVTPLPSPLLSQHSPGPWRRLGASPPSRESMPLPNDPHLTASPQNIRDDGSPRTLQHPPHTRSTPTPARHESQSASGSGGPSHQHQHSRGRSISVYVPDPLLIPKRHGTVSGAHLTPGEVESAEPHLRREAHLAEARGITPTITKPPTPPPSESSRDTEVADAPADKAKPNTPEIFKARDRFDGKKRKWQAVRFLGQGTFSRVILATSQIGAENNNSSIRKSGAPTPTVDPDRKTLVAVKVCEHGPRGGASEDRIEMSLKRELEIMKCIRHPSLVHLKAWSIEPTRALLVLSYCPGGDLFDVATSHRELLGPSLLRRMFAELIGAVQYLHNQLIVHRDIKLESRSPPQNTLSFRRIITPTYEGMLTLTPQTSLSTCPPRNSPTPPLTGSSIPIPS